MPHSWLLSRVSTYVIFTFFASLQKLCQMMCLNIKVNEHSPEFFILKNVSFNEVTKITSTKITFMEITYYMVLVTVLLESINIKIKHFKSPNRDS